MRFKEIHYLTREFRATSVFFGKLNTRGNVSKISVSLACYRQIGSKSTNHSPLACRKEGQKVILVAVIGGIRSELLITRKTDGNFGNVSVGVLRICKRTPIISVTPFPKSNPLFQGRRVFPNATHFSKSDPFFHFSFFQL